MPLDAIDRKLFGLVQAAFPIASRPYAGMGLSLGITEDEVISRIGRMKANGLVRQIGPVLDPGRLGYRTTLAAMRVSEANLDRAAELLAEHPGISHAYERDHHFNVWFTLSLPAGGDVHSEIHRLGDIAGAGAAFDLPVVKRFKLRAYFGPDGDRSEEPEGASAGRIHPEKSLSAVDRRAINELQQDLPLISRPFARTAARVGMDEDGFFTLCRSLLSRGIIRRFGASVNHRSVGFTANAMTCWVVPAEKVESIAVELVPLKQVSHCYERKTNPQWCYNLFAIIHGHTRKQCEEIASRVSAETGLDDYVLLFSTREFKKTRVIYKV